MLNTSIASLATCVCVAQKGYCLLDDDNQLQERPPAEMVFLSACAPDFLDPDGRSQARQELQKYFIPPNKTGKWRSHGAYHGRHALRIRIMDIWHRVFTACADQNVSHPSLLPMGLGIFRPKVAEPDTIPLYFEVWAGRARGEGPGRKSVGLWGCPLTPGPTHGGIGASHGSQEQFNVSTGMPCDPKTNRGRYWGRPRALGENLSAYGGVPLPQDQRMEV